ncbi:hypothetical protein [Mycolicibacter senuensis]|uniref:Uncharacterized protein n=1 Tax=Mycolicibacter senuensis TaxID=386913 RepID=A0A7I9XQT0_9MYCO|nr:hypothetical protein [Mycolicibacter senuensis]GFG71850.1 hypothetical protein MSEN_35700 [Mycolicibacter senuensis]
MSAKIRQALCCTCGEVRTCRQARNRQRENYWLCSPVDPNWHRELGDLKCANCGEITRHAILHREGDPHRDHAERITRIALGGKDPYGDAYTATRHQIREAYRQGRQPNPLMNHLWATSDAQAARKAGRTTVITFCGEVQKLPEKSRTRGGDELLQPDPVRFDQEYEDPETGGWWVEMDCPDCYRVANEERMATRRQHLKLLLACALAHWSDADRLPDAHVEDLIAALRAAQVGASE